MKHLIIFLFLSGVLTLTACESKPKTEEAAVDSTAATLNSAGTMIDSAATATVDSAAAATSATMPGDSLK